jgi:hypothetical protein
MFVIVRTHMVTMCSKIIFVVFMLLTLSARQYISSKLIGSNIYLKLYIQRVKITEINNHTYLPILRLKETNQFFHKRVLLQKYFLS